MKNKMIRVEYHDGRPAREVPFTATKHLRQGDTLLECVKSIPKGATKSSLKGGVIAEGEVTGHAHRLRGEYTVFSANGNTYFKVGKGGVRYEHEEHGHMLLPEGTSYCIGPDSTKIKETVAPNANQTVTVLGSAITVQREWSPEGDRSVRD